MIVGDVGMSMQSGEEGALRGDSECANLRSVD